MRHASALSASRCSVRVAPLLAINGEWISAPEDDRFDFVISVATGGQADVPAIAGQLRAWSSRGEKPFN